MSRFQRVGLYRTNLVSYRATAVASSNQVLMVVVVISGCIRSRTFAHTSAAGFMLGASFSAKSEQVGPVKKAHDQLIYYTKFSPS